MLLQYIGKGSPSIVGPQEFANLATRTICMPMVLEFSSRMVYPRIFGRPVVPGEICCQQTYTLSFRCGNGSNFLFKNDNPIPHLNVDTAQIDWPPCPSYSNSINICGIFLEEFFQHVYILQIKEECAYIPKLLPRCSTVVLTNGICHFFSLLIWGRGYLLIPRSSGALAVPRCSGGRVVPRSSVGLVAPRSSGSLVALRSSGSLSVLRSSGGLVVPCSSGSLVAPRSSGGLVVPRSSGGLAVQRSSGGASG
ncbi:hypothetical protein AVEN_216335-1 [Araneus ventricosus]|uniref:Uncharacterized protein n=1 Tax=Araneus ventricosus TaxID=182803 RepID=A0A4Y2T850_ARAVE|nr:hypothetical protein AVEN_216335-1 [Araneus ventricosus]